MKEHFLQSPLWEQYEQLEGYQTFRLKDQDFSALAVLQTTPVGNYLFCPYGPTLKSPDSLPTALAALKKLAHNQNAFFLRIEPTFPLPDSLINSLHLQKSHDLDPAHTWVLDLSPSTDELLKGMESRKVRYWRNHQKKGISIRQSHDPAEITILTKLLTQLGDKDNFIPQPEEHLKNQLKSGFATLYIAELSQPDQPKQPASAKESTAKDKSSSEDNAAPSTNQAKIPIAAALIYDYNSTRYYAHAAANSHYQKLAAGTIVLIQMILDAKDQDAKVYDFWGMTPSADKKHPWYGFTQYKKSFGGRQVDYTGTYDLPIKPFRYRLYLAIRRLNRLKRKLLH